MSMPVMCSEGQALYDAVWQLAGEDEANDWALAKVCNAIGMMRQRAADLYEDRDGLPGWSQLFSVDRCPAYALPFLAQVAGTTVTVGAPEEVQRDEVRRHAGSARGRPASIIAAVQATLTGTKTVRLLERVGGNAWRFTVVTRTAETPDAAATYKAILSQKPLGMIATHIISDAPIIDEGTETIDASTGNIDTATLADIT